MIKGLKLGMIVMSLAVLMGARVSLAQDIRPPTTNPSTPEISSTATGSLLLVMCGVVALVEGARRKSRKA